MQCDALEVTLYRQRLLGLGNCFPRVTSSRCILPHRAMRKRDDVHVWYGPPPGVPNRNSFLFEAAFLAKSSYIWEWLTILGATRSRGVGRKDGEGKEVIIGVETAQS